MGSSVVYDKDYDFECEFVHCSNVSAGIVARSIDNSISELQIVPTYEELLFMSCCRLALKHGILMIRFLAELLADLLKEKADTWQTKSAIAIKEIGEWLDNLEGTYGSN